jgi:hypothetical protein
MNSQFNVAGNALLVATTTIGTGGTLSLGFRPTSDMNVAPLIQAVSNLGPTSASQYSAGFKFTTVDYSGGMPIALDALTISAKGYVGVGTTNPLQKLIVINNGYNAGFYSGDTNNDGILFNTPLGGAQQIMTDYNGTGAEQSLILGTYNNRAFQQIGSGWQ